MVRARGTRLNRGLDAATATAERRRPLRIGRILGLLVALATTASAAPGTFAPTADARVIVQCPDPTMLIGPPGPSAFTLICTAEGLPTRSASSLAGLSAATPQPAFAPDGWPQWSVGGFWAPDLEQVGGQYLLYFSAKRKGDHRRCIGVAISDRPDGDFHDIGQPLVTNDRDGAIDPALVRAQGALYLLYKRDGNAFRHPSIIYGRPLDPSGTVVGPRKVLLRSQRGGWEGGVVEGPTAIGLGTTTYLLYSGGYFLGSGYAEGEAIRHGTPLGPFRRIGKGPVLQGYGRWVGTGGGSIVDAGGKLFLAYNAFPKNEHPPQRRLFIRPLGLVRGVLRPKGPPRRIPLSGALTASLIKELPRQATAH